MEWMGSLTLVGSAASLYAGHEYHNHDMQAMSLLYESFAGILALATLYFIFSAYTVGVEADKNLGARK